MCLCSDAAARLFCMLQLSDVYARPTCAEASPAMYICLYNHESGSTCTVASWLYLKVRLKLYRSQLSAGQERQEDLITKVSSLEEAQAAFQAESAARPSDSFVDVPFTGQVGLMKPLAVMYDHATMILRTHTGNVADAVSSSHVNVCLPCVCICEQSRRLWSRAKLLWSTGTIKSSAAGIGKTSLHGFSVPTDVFHVTPHVTDSPGVSEFKVSTWVQHF